MDFQVEYLVVSFDEEQHNVKLSLRQADILAALASNAEITNPDGIPGIVPNAAQSVEPSV